MSAYTTASSLRLPAALPVRSSSLPVSLTPYCYHIQQLRGGCPLERLLETKRPASQPAFDLTVLPSRGSISCRRRSRRPGTAMCPDATGRRSIAVTLSCPPSPQGGRSAPVQQRQPPG